MNLAKRAYEPMLARVLGNAPVVLASSIVLVVLSGLLASRLGSEFIPSLNEGDIAIQALRIPATGLTESVEMQKKIESGLKAKFPEIDRVFARTGTAEVASDPMPQDISDGYIMLKPEASWPVPKKSHAELVEAIQKEARKYAGNAYEFSQPIQLRFNELISGVRSDVAVKVYGDDMDVLAKTGQEIAAVLEKIPGASEVKVEQTGGLPMLSVSIDRERTARVLTCISYKKAGHRKADNKRRSGQVCGWPRRKRGESRNNG
jgi:cobalt-zinc-cadmium resistance protein CzcA